MINPYAPSIVWYNKDTHEPVTIEHVRPRLDGVKGGVIVFRREDFSLDILDRDTFNEQYYWKGLDKR